jgi:hypothetical protein
VGQPDQLDFFIQDESANEPELDLIKLKQDLTREEIIDIVTSLGADNYIDMDNVIVFPTICHNPVGYKKSMKLYYYFNTCLFHCYTECDDSFDIYKLICKVAELNDEEMTFMEAVNYVIERHKGGLIHLNNQYRSRRDRYRKRLGAQKLEKKNTNILDIFRFRNHPEWVKEGISRATMEKFGILYSTYRNKIIIPHVDVDGDLVGIRGRALNEDEVAMGNKYMPVKINGQFYSHPLSLNLYGLYHNKAAIKRIKRAIIVEGEKSVLLGEEFLKEDNICVASCGSSLHRPQVQLLVQLGVQEIIIGFDKEFEKYGTEEFRTYNEKLNNLCLKYINYSNFSYIIDTAGLLRLKDSPLDRGAEVFHKLYNDRVQARRLII